MFNFYKKKNIFLILAGVIIIISIIVLFLYLVVNSKFSKIEGLSVKNNINSYINNFDIAAKLIILETEKNAEIKNDSKKASILKGFSKNVPILMYHYIDSAPASSTLKSLYLEPKIFVLQLEELQKNNYETLFVSEVAKDIKNKNSMNRKIVALTFDDAYEDFYSNAFPLLKKYNTKATLYVIINALGTKGYLTREQVREMTDSGLVEIGSHTFNHPDLRKLKIKDAKFEIEASKKKLEAISGKTVLSFCYPFGLYNKDFFSILSEASYLTAISTIPGTRQGEENIWILRRIRPNDRSGQVFINWLQEWEKSAY